MSDNTAIILAAINASGPNDGDDYQSRVIANAKNISVLLGENSPVNKAITQMENSKNFTAIVGPIVKEKSSTRGLVKLKTKPSGHSPEGQETARTDRTDNPEGKAMAKRLQSLLGHRVLLWVEVEEYSSSNGSGKVRVIRHVEDLGEAEEPVSDEFWAEPFGKKAS
jgi:hypothetical protein